MTESVIPTMPEDWWPNEILVTGRHGNVELAFAIVSKEGVETIPQSMDGLRQAIWQAAHDPEFNETLR